jgi:hypothetical protein
LQREEAHEDRKLFLGFCQRSVPMRMSREASIRFPVRDYLEAQ